MDISRQGSIDWFLISSRIAPWLSWIACLLLSVKKSQLYIQSIATHFPCTLLLIRVHGWKDVASKLVTVLSHFNASKNGVLRLNQGQKIGLEGAAALVKVWR
jgi:hypothetical protein